jgi:hypothetical protein
VCSSDLGRDKGKRMGRRSEWGSPCKNTTSRWRNFSKRIRKSFHERWKSLKERIMDGVQLLFTLKKLVELRRDDVVNGMVSGVDNFEKYQYMLGQIRTYHYILQEISNLLKNKEPNEDGNVVKIKPQDHSPKT